MSDRPTIRAIAPCRVDLAGGTLDLWPLSQLVEDAVTVNAAIDVFAECRVRPAAAGWTFHALDTDERFRLDELSARPEREVPPSMVLAAACTGHFRLPPSVIETKSEASRGSGLGGSSSLIIAIIAAMAAAVSRELDPARTVELACNLETRILGLPAGIQDHWAARVGGIGALEFGAEGTRHVPLPGAAEALDRALVVADTRVAHHSGMNNWTVFSAFLEGEPTTREALAEVGRAAADMRRALTGSGNPDDMLAAAREALTREWAARRLLSPAVTCPEVERIVEAAVGVGGAAKVCGAGGGGCVVCLAPSAAERGSLVDALEDAGARALPAKVQPDGVTWERLG